MGARRIDPDALIAYRYQMRTEGLFRAGPALAIGAFSIEAGRRPANAASDAGRRIGLFQAVD
jgi:hypothetical protein